MAETETGNKVAPEGFVFVCMACGKRSRDRYGDQAIDPGWDVSCMLWSRLLPVDAITLGPDGRVVKIDVKEIET